ncbi:phosphate signaling complex protein PhoU, partial [Vibrio campbellii]
MEYPKDIPSMLQIMTSASAIERVGDRCQNICEYIVYFVLGKDVRHLEDDDLGRALNDI